MSRHAGVVVCLLLLSLASMAHSQPGIVFMRIVGGEQDIYRIQPDGTGLVSRIANNPANDTQPCWSPDNSQIAFASSRDGNVEVYKMNADGTAQTRLTNHGAVDGSPDWSPDGAWIAFESNRTGRYQIYKIRPDGSNLTQLTSSAGDSLLPCWSPGSTHIVFISSRDGNRDVFVMGADGGNQVPLTRTPENEESPRWSWVGNRIVYAKWRTGQRDIWLMNAGGTGQQVLEGSNNDDFTPDWSPDAARIVFSRTLSPSLMVMNANGTGLTQITGGYYDIYPHWAHGCSNRRPIASAGPDRTVEANASGGATVVLDGSASSDPDGDALLYTWSEGSTVLAGPSGSPIANVFLGLGSHEVTVLADDQKGGTATDAATITVVDTTPPSLTVPAAITVEASATGGAPRTDPAIAAFLVAATAADVCDPEPGLTNDAPDLLEVGKTTTVTWVAVDASGNSASRASTVTVQDTTAPAITDFKPTPHTLWPPNGKLWHVMLSYALSDIADGSPSAAITLVTCNEASFSPGDYVVVDATHLKLRAKREGGNKAGRVYTVTVRATDAAGNATEEQVTVTVPHDDGQVKITGQAAIPTRCGAEITFSLSRPAAVSATVRNITGRPVKRLTTHREAGPNTLLWNAMSDMGLRAPAGMYLVEVEANADDGSRARVVVPLRLNR